MIATAANIGGRVWCIFDGARRDRCTTIKTIVHIHKGAAIGRDFAVIIIVLWSLWDRRVGTIAVHTLTTVLSLNTLLMWWTFYVLTIIEETLTVLAVLIGGTFNTVARCWHAFPSVARLPVRAFGLTTRVRFACALRAATKETLTRSVNTGFIESAAHGGT